MKAPTMPFGRYRGRRICHLPDDYLTWLIENIDLRQPLLGHIERELKHREEAEVHAHDRRRRTTCDPEAAEELIGAGLHVLARRYHPDAGGDHQRMVAINNAADWLRLQARGLAS
jgi:hypothetical protein